MRNIRDVIDYIYLGNTRIAAVVFPAGECKGDLDNDWDVDGSDLAVFAADFGRTDCDIEPPCEGDFDHDNDVDGSDLAIFAGDFGRTDCPEEEIYYYHNDHLGTPQKMTDVNGAVVWSADYRPFGQADITVNTVANNFRFPGQYYDQETGLHYNWHRYYDPYIGRYINADPIGVAGGMNLYAYVDANPINLTDPEGLIAKFCTRAAFVSDKKKKSKKYIPGGAHCYLIANDRIFSWHTSWGGGVALNEYPASNDCSELHCNNDCSDGNKDKELEDCIYQSGLDLTKDPGNLWLPPVWDCCDVARTVVRNCKARVCNN